MHRRRFLVLGSTALLPTLAGCGGEEFDPVETKKVVGSAPGIELAVTPEREYEYLPETDEVRFEWSDETKPMDEWGTRRAADAAADAVSEHLRSAEIDDHHIHVGVHDFRRSEVTTAGTGQSADVEFDRDRPLGVFVQSVYTYARNGSLYSKPDIHFEDVVAVVPRSAAVTIHLPEDEYRTVLPVICWRFWRRFE